MQPQEQAEVVMGTSTRAAAAVVAIGEISKEPLLARTDSADADVTAALSSVVTFSAGAAAVRTAATGLNTGALTTAAGVSLGGGATETA